MDTISRKHAKGQGLPYYFTGKPCKHNHISKRLTDSGVCYSCSLLFKKTNKSKASYKQYREQHRSTVNTRSLKYYHTVLADNLKDLRKVNPLEGYKHQRAWEKRNPGKKQAISSRRRAALLKAVPPWFEQEREEIKQLYVTSHQLTKTTGVLYTVDHIVPLQGNTVCGLHCLANLRILIGSENFSKNNRLL